MLRFIIGLMLGVVLSKRLVKEDVGVYRVELWQKFKKTFNKKYNTTEDSIRFQIFTQNLYSYAQLNEENPLATFGVTKFSDLSEGEFLAYHSCEGEEIDTSNEPRTYYSQEEVLVATALGAGVDWRAKGAVTSVKNQGNCGSCWAFETVGNIEGVWFLKTGNLTSLSAQELVACELNDLACRGGRCDTALKWLMSERNGQIESDDDYPYTSAGGMSPGCAGHLCKALNAAVSDAWCISNCYSRGTKNCPPTMCDCSGKDEAFGAKITSFQRFPADEDQIATALSKNGPIAIAVAADSWSGYTGGIMSNCRASTVDHGVLLVGYADDYWIIKNSWGANWGESGFIRLKRGSNQCNMNSRALSAQV